MRKPLTISLVIPVYNEEDHLAACLQAALDQQLPFTEIIVVDNNSTDNTVAIANQFPAVRLLREARQGVVHARTRGFNAARGAILARIDADTRLPTDWTQTVQQLFQDSKLSAVTGRMTYHDMAAPQLCNRVDLALRRYLAQRLGQDVALQAANMALRRSAWRAVRRELCTARGLHEDLDLGIHLTAAGYQVQFAECLTAAIGFRQADSTFRAFCAYVLLNPYTFRYHRLKSQRYIYPVAALAISCYVVLKLLHQRSAVDSGRWLRLRVNPATFTD